MPRAASRGLLFSRSAMGEGLLRILPSPTFSHRGRCFTEYLFNYGSASLAPNTHESGIGKRTKDLGWLGKKGDLLAYRHWGFTYTFFCFHRFSSLASLSRGSPCIVIRFIDVPILDFGNGPVRTLFCPPFRRHLCPWPTIGAGSVPLTEQFCSFVSGGFQPFHIGLAGLEPG